MRSRELAYTIFLVLPAILCSGVYVQDSNDMVLDYTLDGLDAEYHLNQITGETYITITNNLMSEPVMWSLDLAMTGGRFALEWVDSNMVSHPVDDFVVYTSEDATDVWNAESTLPARHSTRAIFTPVWEAQYYVLTYTGDISGQTVTASHTKNALRTICEMPANKSLFACFRDLKHWDYDRDKEVALNMRGILLSPYQEGSGIVWKASPSAGPDHGRQVRAACSSDGDIFVWVRADKSDSDYMFHSGHHARRDYLPQWIANDCLAARGISNCDGYGGGTVIRESIYDTWQRETEQYRPGDQVIGSGWYTEWNRRTKMYDRVEEDEVYEVYTCIKEHIPDANTEPGTGSGWQDVWIVGYPDVRIIELALDGVSEKNEEEPGGFLLVDDTVLRLALNIGVGPYALPPNIGTAKLEIVGDPNSIRIWDNALQEGDPFMDVYINSMEWDLDHATWLSPLYVQGLEVGTSEIVFSFIYAGQIYFDKVKVTVTSGL